MNKDKKKIEYVSEENIGDIDKKLKKTRDKLKFCEKERAEYLAGWQRAKADLINYKREQETKISEYYKFANEGLILDILPVLDSFEMAMKHLSENEKDKNNGIEQIRNQLKSILKNNGVEEIQAVGEKFNPELHESIEVVEGKESGLVVEEVQKGYGLHGKIIRPSKVRVGK